MKTKIAEIIYDTRADIAAMQKSDKVIKLMEEVGELAKSVLTQDNKLPNNPADEEPLYEIADCMLILIDILSACYPHLPATDLVADLEWAVDKKYAKWKTYMRD